MRMIYNPTLLLTVFALFLQCSLPIHSDYPDKKFTESIIVDGEKINLEDGLDLSGKNLHGVIINRQLGTLKNVKFDHADLTGANLDETSFIDCSFRHATLRDVYAPFTCFEGSAFDSAKITRSQIGLSLKQIMQTVDYKHKSLPNMKITCNLSNANLSNFNLKNSDFLSATITQCNFTDASISRSLFRNMTKEQLLSTNDFKRSCVIGVIFHAVDLSNVDLSRMNLSECRFYVPAFVKGEVSTFNNTILVDSVISGCDLSGVTGLTLAQIKSTWNYKMGRMAGIRLPLDIQAVLDEEQKQKEEPK